MKNFRFTFNLKDFLIGLAIGAAFLALASCTTVPIHDKALIGTVAVGGSQSKGTVDQDSLTGSGGLLAVRLETTKAVDYVKNTEVGLRVGIAGRDSNASPDDVPVHAESGELSLVGTVRSYLPVTETVALYGEGFAGYAHNWGTIKGGPIDAQGDGGSPVFGFGAGVATSPGLRLGIEWSRRDFELDDLQIRADDFAIVVGGVLRF